MIDEMEMQSQFKKNKNQKKDRVNFEIVEYKPEFKTKYKDLNYEWLKKYFEIESSDEKILSNPDKEIIEKNGFIFFALFKGEAIGTCTLIRHDDVNCELSKMCVTEQYQGKGAGEQLIDEAISKACQLGTEKIFLCTNRKLNAAFNLYRKKGFQVIRDPIPLHSPYKRESIFMCLNVHDVFEEDE